MLNLFEIRTCRYHKGDGYNHPLIVAAETASKAKYAAFLQLDECFDTFSDFLHDIYSCRKTGIVHPVPDNQVEKVGRRAGLSGVRLGSRVHIRGTEKEGIIVGTNNSANFDVLFAGSTLPANVHPGDIIILG